MDMNVLLYINIIMVAMTKDEKNLIYNALRRNTPDYFDKLMQKVNKKREMILTCIEIASNGNDDGYQDEVNRLYNTCCSLMNKTETYMLNYICLIKHKEQFNDRQNDDTDIRKWVGYLQEFLDSANNENSTDSIIGILDKQARQIINQYRTKKPVGRPKGTGKKIFSYNGKNYHTIQECADDYGISKQGMHKRLKKMCII